MMYFLVGTMSLMGIVFVAIGYFYLLYRASDDDQIMKYDLKSKLKRLYLVNVGLGIVLNISALIYFWPRLLDR